MIKRFNYRRIERLLFFFVAIANLFTVMGGKYFPTMDGAAHLYNSNIIVELLFSDNSLFDEFYSFNEILVPNWMGHAILALFNLFFPAYIAEKILLSIYFLGLPYAFRHLLKIIKPQNVEFSYMIFPFCYSFVFALGFYNFSLAVVIMLLTLTFWFKKSDNVLTSKSTLILAFMLTGTYFSHIFLFALVLLFIGMHILFSSLLQRINHGKELNLLLGELLKKSGKVLIASVVPMVLLGLYFFSGSGQEGEYSFLETEQLASWIVEVKPIIAYNADAEGEYTRIVFYVIFALIVLSLLKRMCQLRDLSDKTVTKSALKTSDYWLISAVIVGVMYFTLPNSDQAAGSFSVRFALLLYVFSIIWVSTQKFSKWLIWISVVTILYANDKLNAYYSEELKILNFIAVHYESAAEYIEPNSVVLAVKYSHNWLAINFSNYLGVEKPMVILDNYELETGYFPLTWNEQALPKLLLNKTEFDNFACANWPNNPDNSERIIDYIFLMGNFPEQSDSCQQVIHEGYELKYKAEHCSLYKFKRDE